MHTNRATSRKPIWWISRAVSVVVVSYAINAS